MQNTVTINGIPFNLNELEKDCWVRLLNGALRSKDVLHNPAVANTNIHGINIRTVVLRAVDTVQKQLVFHTDIRSGKWADLQKDNKISWHFYDASARIQIRAAGFSTLHTCDALSDAEWQKNTPNSRKIYMGENSPSKISVLPVSGLPVRFENTEPSVEESETGRKNFGLVVTTVNWMEWLWLNNKGHRRASFNYNTDKSFKANWLIP